MAITLTAVKSSNIKAIGYDAPTSTLAVQFANGSVFEYAGVPQASFDALQKADSVGSYFAKAIRPIFKGVPAKA